MYNEYDYLIVNVMMSILQCNNVSNSSIVDDTAVNYYLHGFMYYILIQDYMKGKSQS